MKLFPHRKIQSSLTSRSPMAIQAIIRDLRILSRWSSAAGCPRDKRASFSTYPSGRKGEIGAKRTGLLRFRRGFQFIPVKNPRKSSALPHPPGPFYPALAIHTVPPIPYSRGAEPARLFVSNVSIRRSILLLRGWRTNHANWRTPEANFDGDACLPMPDTSR